jgi:four helix bundle protein
MEIFYITDKFPKIEIYSHTDQIRRSSRSVCANIAEAFRKRRYRKAFIAKLSDAESEAAETQVWLDFAYNCKYIDENTKDYLYQQYDYIIGKQVNMINNSDKWYL